MEHHQNTGYTILSIFSTVISWLSLANAQYFVSFTASIVALISGLMALRYYYYAGNEKRNQLNKDKNGN